MDGDQGSEEKSFDYFGPGFIMAIIVAGISDLVVLAGMMALFIPVVGIIFMGPALLAHYLVSIIVGFLMFPQLTSLPSRFVLGLAIIIPVMPVLPLPWLTGAVIWAGILENKMVQRGVNVALKELEVEKNVVKYGAALMGQEEVVAAIKMAERAEQVMRGGVQIAGATSNTGQQMSPLATDRPSASLPSGGNTQSTSSAEAEHQQPIQEPRESRIPKGAFGEQPEPMEEVMDEQFTDEGMRAAEARERKRKNNVIGSPDRFAQKRKPEEGGIIRDDGTLDLRKPAA